ncbi:MAG: single-stranded DNA-binding protein [Planctomycetes bacterium]|nr:single-stranded DNA-binding protein [Planctomycetota bacterium]
MTEAFHEALPEGFAGTDDTNSVLLTGRLTAKPELRYTQSGTAVGTLRVAITRSLPETKTRGARTETAIVEVTAWGRQAEACASHLAAGSTVAIEGRLEVEAWEGRDGARREKLKVTAHRVQFLGRPAAGAAGGSPAASRTTVAKTYDDDVPF